MRTRDVPRRSGVRRRGMTIIETVVLMAGVATMLGICAVLLQLLMKLDADSRVRFAGAAAAARLAEQFRHDVHAAEKARIEPAKGASAPAVLRLDLGAKHAVAYRVEGLGAVQRLESRAGSNERRERYEIPHRGAVELAVRDEKGRSFATLTIDREAAAGRNESAKAFEAAALVGKNRNRVRAAAGADGEQP